MNYNEILDKLYRLAEGADMNDIDIVGAELRYLASECDLLILQKKEIVPGFIRNNFALFPMSEEQIKNHKKLIHFDFSKYEEEDKKKHKRKLKKKKHA